MQNWMIPGVALALLCSGCAVGVKHQYDNQPPDLPVSSTETVEVGVLDQRPYVLDNHKSPAFVGVSRGGFSNPFDVETASGQPLATDMGADIVSALRASGVKASQMVLAPSLKPADARQQLVKSGTDRSVLITLLEWKSDTYQRVFLNYDVRLNVFNKEDQSLAASQASGEDNLGDGGLDPPSHSRKVVPQAFKKIMEGLFKDPKVVEALK
ncbi:MAG TPA: hypothetical protein VMH26_20865 [Burkholderiales bacterium]|nr:hypothetical protein [Burkholderiales bacterium]